MSAHADMTSREFPFFFITMQRWRFSVTETCIGYDNDVKMARAASSLCEVQPFTLDLKISYI